MDNKDEMTLFLLQDEKNDVADQDEHFTILAALLQIQADDLHNAAATCGGSNFGIRDRTRNGRGWRSMPCYTLIILPTMHRLAERNFAADLG
jgi:hypothetical protein